jgi:putative hydrolase of the HAD superfamily
MKAVGFDLGDTLIFNEGTPMNWKSLYHDALNSVTTACNCIISPRLISDAAEILKEYNTRLNPRRTEVISDEIIERILESWGLSKQHYLDIATDSFFLFFQRQVAAYDDTIPVLRTLRQENLKIGVLTDVPYGMKRVLVQHILDTTGISTLIDVLLTSVDIGYRKPETIGYFRLAYELGAKPQEMIFVGNEKKDIEGANRAGMYSVLLSRDGEKHTWGQEEQIESLYELGALI